MFCFVVCESMNHASHMVSHFSHVVSHSHMVRHSSHDESFFS